MPKPVEMRFLGCPILLILAGMPGLAQAQTGTTNPPPPAPPMIGDSPETIPPRALFVADIRALKIGEDESPRPMDRIGVAFHFYDNVNPELSGALGIGRADVSSLRFQVEKTFLGGRASIGLRLPVQTVRITDFSGPGLGTKKTAFGEGSLIFKYAAIDKPGGIMISTGLMLTIPTGLRTADPTRQDLPRTGFIQPFLGYEYNRERWYLHGFSSLAVPTRATAAQQWFNDAGAGWWVYRSRNRDALITGISPTVEVHGSYAFNNSRSSYPINNSTSILPSVQNFLQASFNVTEGVVFELGGRTWLTFGIGESVAHPKIFDVEGIVQLNYRFGGRK